MIRRPTESRRAAALLAVFLAAAAPPPARAAIDVQKVPNPMTSSGRWVEDSGGLLGPDEIALINAVCETLKQKTSAELAVVTVDNLGGLTIEDFAARLFNRFGIGVAGEENGALLLLSRDDRNVRLEVGYGLEGAIPDAAAVRILDEWAVPHFQRGSYGRGLYEAAREAAKAVGDEAGISLEIVDPSSWPAQGPPSLAVAGGSTDDSREMDGRRDIDKLTLISGSAVLLFVLLGALLVVVRFFRGRSRGAREKAARGSGVIGLTWLGSLVGFFLLSNAAGSPLPSLLSFLLVPSVATFGYRRMTRALRKKAASYRPPCPSCRLPMRLLDERADDAFLSAEEIAEEEAGGMNYEIWECSACGTTERFALALPKAGSCPRCRRRTLVTTTTTLVAATMSSGGKVRVDAVCKNPACGFRTSRERNTARRGSTPVAGGHSSSGRSSSGSSSRSSFGGGRSGGGGASRRF